MICLSFNSTTNADSSLYNQNVPDQESYYILFILQQYKLKYHCMDTMTMVGTKPWAGCLLSTALATARKMLFPSATQTLPSPAARGKKQFISRRPAKKKNKSIMMQVPTGE